MLPLPALKLTEKAKDVVIKLLFIALCVGGVWTLYQMHQAKNAKIELLNKEVSETKTKLADAEKNLKIQEDTAKITEDVTAKVVKEEVKVIKVETEASKYVTDKLAAIEKKYKDLEQTPANIERKNIEISVERMRGIWFTYCLQEPEDKACKK